jgi:hypothetical protein
VSAIALQVAPLFRALGDFPFDLNHFVSPLPSRSTLSIPSPFLHFSVSKQPVTLALTWYSPSHPPFGPFAGRDRRPTLFPKAQAP